MNRLSRTANRSFLTFTASIRRSLYSSYNRRFTVLGVSGGDGVASRTVACFLGLAFGLAFATASSRGRRFGLGGGGGDSSDSVSVSYSDSSLGASLGGSEETQGET